MWKYFDIIVCIHKMHKSICKYSNSIYYFYARYVKCVVMSTVYQAIVTAEEGGVTYGTLKTGLINQFPKC